MAHNISITDSEATDQLIPASDRNAIQQRHKKIIKRKLKPGMNVINIKTTMVEHKTEGQKRLINSIRTFPQTITYGCAGTGKSYVTAALAAEMLQQGKIKKIVLTRPNIPTGKSIGFFPGELEEKMAPWTKPFTEVLCEKLGANAVECMKKNGKIEIVPMETIRGRSFEDSFVVLDEAQNCTIEEIKCFVTRVGMGSKLVINGDISQADIRNSGLGTIIDMIHNNADLEEQTGVIKFTVDDVVRSDVCASWIRAFDKEGL